MSDASLLPPNSTQLERALAGAAERFSALPLPHRELMDPSITPAQLLPWLAWEVSVDEWAPEWQEQQKRGAIAASISIHRHKGTIGAVRAGLAGIGINVRVQEWFAQLPAGEPGTFHLLVDASQYPVTLDNLHRVIAVLENSKNLRSHLDGIYISARSSAQLHSAVVVGIGHEITLTDYRAAMLVINELAIVLE